jgi:multiple antibiotic resistance protein
MLLGPLKIIPAFMKLTREADRAFKRDVAIKASMTASALVVVIVLLGKGLVARYEISLDSVRIAGGLVLLLSALKVVFPGPEPVRAESVKPTALQLAISPVAMPITVPPAGVAAILITLLLAPTYPGMGSVIVWGLATMMTLDFLAMYFIDTLAEVPGLLLLLQVLGAVLIFIQIALAIETFLVAFRDLALIR